MVEEERYCIDVLNQIEAARSALSKIALGWRRPRSANALQGGKGATEAQLQEPDGAVGRAATAGMTVYTTGFG